MIHGSRSRYNVQKALEKSSLDLAYRVHTLAFPIGTDSLLLLGQHRLLAFSKFEKKKI